MKVNSDNVSKKFQKFLCGLMVLCVMAVLCYAQPAFAAEDVEPISQTVEVGIPIEENPELFMPHSMPTHGEGKIAAFLIEFPDFKNDNPYNTVEYYEKLYFDGGVESPDSWSNISVANFYKTQSYGKLNLSGKVFDWYMAKNERSYYDNRKNELIIEAAEYYMSQGVDFSNFDGDGDGVIDAITFHFTGDVTEARYTPWYSGLCIWSGGTIGNMKFTTMVQVAEQSKYNSSVSTVCHELMHTLGIPDLYSEVDENFGLRDLMGYNQCIINPYTKILLGWVDEIQVITDNIDNVRLNLYGNQSVGEIAIITDEFNGLWDEFYVVAFTSFDLGDEADAAIWHIDARLTDDQMAFKYQNFNYTPNPDKDTGHFDENTNLSQYPFIEELFCNDSALGPNTVPSSDTHDGQYTGLKIDNFQKYNNEYLTFAVSIIDDTLAPVVVTKEKELVIREEIRILFSERIYKGENWDQIFVTDLDGNALDMSTAISNIPNNEMKITFNTDSYKNGYKIILPEGCLRDSSGNRTEQITFVAVKENYIHSTGEVQLPNSEYIRNNSSARFFPHDDNLVIITDLASNVNGQNAFGSKFEFMRLDNEGNVISQIVIDSPFEINTRLYGVVETYDNCYIFVLANSAITSMDGGDLLFCIDSNGSLKWVNDDYYDTGFMFSPSNNTVKYPDGIWSSVSKDLMGLLELAFINSENGDIQIVEYRPINNFQLPNNQELCLREVYINGKLHKFLEIIDSITKETVVKGTPKDSHEQDFTVLQTHANNDGTIMIELFKWRNSSLPSSREIILLDASLNTIKSVRLSDESNKTLCWFAGDGFCEIDRVKSAMHDDSEYHIRRYDRYLNLIWEADSDANFIYFFKSATGNIWAYKSMLLPETVCYIEYYENENPYTIEHIHNMVFNERNYTSCLEQGTKTHWRCSGCGCIYADGEGHTLITDVRALVHSPSNDHNYEDWVQSTAPNCEKEGVERRDCTNCDKCETRNIPALGHKWTEEDHYKVCEFCDEMIELEKDHSKCEASLFKTIINIIINFFRSLLGLPEKCVCGEGLH